MSTIKVNSIKNTSTDDGGIAIDNSGHVQVDGVQLPTGGALSNRNLIINGAMNIAQRNTGSVTVSNSSNEGYSTVDRWFLNFNDAIGGAVSFTQSSDSPAGFANSAKITCSTTDTSFSANQYVALNQRIEAQNLQMLSYGSSDAVSMTLSWYMKTTTYTGPISVVLFTDDGTAEYFAVSVTPTTSWARYSVTIPGSTTASINNDNGRGMYVQFVLAGNTSSSIASSSDSTAWSTTRADFRDDVGNILSSTSNVFFLTGVQLEVGEKETPFEHRSIGDELAKCHRYYQRYTSTTNEGFTIGVTGVFNTTTDAAHVFYFPVEMRAAPSFSVSDKSHFDLEPFDEEPVNTPTLWGTPNTKIAVIEAESPTARTKGFASMLTADVANGYFDFSAEL
jgi:hypothetical protein